MPELTLFQKLISQDPSVRRNAQYELDGLDIPSKTTLIPELINALNHDARAFAATALWRIGPPAEPALIAFLGNEKHEHIARQMAAFALEKLGTPEAKAAIGRFHGAKSGQ